MRMNTTAACLLAALCVTGSAARADALQSVYSDLSLKACAHGANRSPSKRDDHEAVTYRCMGPAGIVISVRYEGTHVNVVFQGGGLAAGGKVLRAEYSIGERLEWRGRQGIKGFEAAAGILRMRRREDSGKFGDVLAVLVRDGAQICPAAFVDASANRDANLLARQKADELAGHFRCGADQPRVAGVATERVQEALDYNR